MKDPRKEGLKQGLRQLTVEELQRVLDYPGEMVLDSYNYQNGCFCPLAIGIGLDREILKPTHDLVFHELTARGYCVYNTRGLVGSFYTTERKRDLLSAAREVLEEKSLSSASPIVNRASPVE